MKTLQYATILVVLGIGGILCAFPACAGVWYVDKAAPPGGDGTAWSTAFTEIQPAIGAAYNDGGGEVWIRAGVYDENRTGLYGSLTLRNGVSLYGGFDGMEDRREERDWVKQETVIDGSTAWGGAQADRVVYGTRINNVAIDGFVVRNGLSSGITLSSEGQATIANCLITKIGAWPGSGISISGEDACIHNVRFIENAGAALHISQGTILVANCFFFQNGAGVEAGSSDLLMMDCEFIENASALYLFSGGRFERCTFHRNTGRYEGAVSYVRYTVGDPRIFINCVFAENYSFHTEGNPNPSSGRGGAVLYTAS
ncbi:MAG TPA: right-handed parallel beta-helix repeat-containing protein [Candidatus Hydrogenedentes bacterium]|nr:right-handed parallel beta-helix repeat-containing protein [Candidatus Hydrogenedentota bacterium]